MTDYDRFFFDVINSEFCKVDELTLKYKYSLKQFMVYKENILQRELFKAANLVDEKRLRDKEKK